MEKVKSNQEWVEISTGKHFHRLLTQISSEACLVCNRMQTDFADG